MASRRFVFGSFCALSIACASAIASLAASPALADTAPTANETGDASTRRVLLRPTPLPAPKPTATVTAALPGFRPTPTPADPPPLMSSRFHLVDLKFERGDILLLGTRTENESAPMASPRVMGRFALELFEGNILIERVRFDFPLLGASTADAGPLSDSKIDARLVSSIGVRFPAVNRGSRFELVDRKTGARFTLPWPLSGASQKI